MPGRRQRNERAVSLAATPAQPERRKQDAPTRLAHSGPTSDKDDSEASAGGATTSGSGGKIRDRCLGRELGRQNGSADPATADVAKNYGVGSLATRGNDGPRPGFLSCQSKPPSAAKISASGDKMAACSLSAN
jgi:hypothetical protein